MPENVGNGGDVLPAVTYFEVAGAIVTVLSLEPTTKMNASSDFALRAWLGKCYVEHVRSHSEIVEAKLLHIYHGNVPSWEHAQYFTTNSIQVRRPADMYLLQFTIEGNYNAVTTHTPVPEATNTPLPEATTLPSTTPVPQSAFVVTMAVSMPMLLSEFFESKQALFKDSIAAVASVPSSDVTIAKIESIASTVTVRRRLLSGGIRVDLRINAATRMNNIRD